MLDEGKLVAAAPYQQLVSQGLNFAAIMQSHAQSHAAAAAAAAAPQGDQTATLVPPELVGEPAPAHAASTTNQEQPQLLPAKDKEGDVLDAAKKAALGALITTEERQTGAVKWEVYREYGKTAGIAVLAFVLLCGLGNAGGSMFADYWLSIWTTTIGSPEALPSSFYLGVYITTMILVTLLSSLQSILVALGGVTAASAFHVRTLAAVMRAPMTFFDSTPVGRILNRFSNDQETLDTQLASSILDFLSCFVYIVSVIAVVILAVWFLLFSA